MARSTPGVESDTDFASGMGIAIGAFIALFAVAIALFVMGQEQPQAAPARRDVAGTRTTALTATVPVAASQVERP